MVAVAVSFPPLISGSTARVIEAVAGRPGVIAVSFFPFFSVGVVGRMMGPVANPPGVVDWPSATVVLMTGIVLKIVAVTAPVSYDLMLDTFLGIVHLSIVD